MEKIFIASQNMHKINEIQYIMGEKYKIYPVSDLIGNIEVEEYGKTFIENSVIKAVTIGDKINKPVIADDSGLCIEALNGFPGINSARFMNDKSYEEKTTYILEKIRNEKNRKAYFVCVATFYISGEFCFSYEGRVYGSISKEIRGNKGFGYDPFFIPDGYEKTFAELGDEIKNEFSHRKLAFEGLIERLSLILKK